MVLQTIMALDLGKFKTVLCVMNVGTRTHRFETVDSTPDQIGSAVKRSVSADPALTLVVSLLLFAAITTAWLSYWTKHPIEAGLPGSSTSVGPHVGFNPARNGLDVGVFYPQQPPRPSWSEYNEPAFIATFQHLPQPGAAHLAGFYLFWRSPAFVSVGGKGRTDYLGCGYSLILLAWLSDGRKQGPTISPISSLVETLGERKILCAPSTADAHLLDRTCRSEKRNQIKVRWKFPHVERCDMRRKLRHSVCRNVPRRPSEVIHRQRHPDDCFTQYVGEF